MPPLLPAMPQSFSIDEANVLDGIRGGRVRPEFLEACKAAIEFTRKNAAITMGAAKRFLAREASPAQAKKLVTLLARTRESHDRWGLTDAAIGKEDISTRRSYHRKLAQTGFSATNFGAICDRLIASIGDDEPFVAVWNPGCFTLAELLKIVVDETGISQEGFDPEEYATLRLISPNHLPLVALDKLNRDKLTKAMRKAYRKGTKPDSGQSKLLLIPTDVKIAGYHDQITDEIRGSATGELYLTIEDLILFWCTQIDAQLTGPISNGRLFYRQALKKVFSGEELLTERRRSKIKAQATPLIIFPDGTIPTLDFSPEKNKLIFGKAAPTLDTTDDDVISERELATNDSASSVEEDDGERRQAIAALS